MTDEAKTDEQLFAELAAAIEKIDLFAPYGMVKIVLGFGSVQIAKSVHAKLGRALAAIDILHGDG